MVAMLIFAALMLTINLKGYKNLFKSSDTINKQQRELLAKAENDLGMSPEPIITLITMGLLVLTAIYYIAAGTIMGDMTVVVVLSAGMGALSIVNIARVPKGVNGELSFGIFSRILVPIVTLYHCYFIYFLLYG